MEKKDIILHIFFCLSSIDFQKKSWLDGEQFDIYCSSFGETINSLDDFNFFDDVEEKLFKFSSKIYTNLESYLKEIEGYEETDNMLKDEKWLGLVQKAKEIYEELKSVSNWW